MTKWVLSAVTGFFGCCLSLAAQETARSVLILSSQVNTPAGLLSTLSDALYFPSLALSDRKISSIYNDNDWIETLPPDFLPPLSAEAPARLRTASKRSSDDKTIPVQPKLFDYVHGEVSVLYGHSLGGKFSRELESGYVLGEIGNDKYDINVGAFYEHSSGHVPRFGR
jgi:hypothetical protein